MKQKLKLLLLSTFILALRPVVFSQITVSPGVNTELCPLEPITITSNAILSTYTIENPKGCRVLSNLSNGTAVISFTDTREEHSFEIKNIHSPTGTKFIYKKIRTLDGVKGAFPTPPPYLVPPGYDDALWMTSGIIQNCSSNSFSYTSPTVRYKDSDGNAFGNPMAFYEWTAPKGWKIDNNISNGSTIITTSAPTAQITPDPISAGEIKVRAKNALCFATGIKYSTWFKIFIDRAALKLTSNGQSSVVVNCGDTYTRTFDVTNAPLFNCITGYDWDLGPTPNGWVYQGAPAPASVFTVNSTLDLATTGTAAPHDISVNIYTSNGLNSTLTADVSFTDNFSSQMQVSEPRILCTTSTYVVDNLRGNAYVDHWEITGANPGCVSSTTGTNSITLTRLQDGDIILTAYIISNCGASTTRSKNINVGGYPKHTGTVIANSTGTSKPLKTYNNVYHSFSSASIQILTDHPNATWQYYWGPVSSWSQSNGVLTFYPTNDFFNSNIVFNIQSTNECGKPISNITYFDHVDYYNPNDRTMALSPNPASGFLVIKELPGKANIAGKKSQGIKEIHVINQQNILVKKVTLSNGTKQTTIDISHLKTGIYFIKVFDGISWTTDKFIKQ